MNAHWLETLRTILASLPTPETERVRRTDALGRILREPIFADRDYPHGDLSMMDGYAVAEVRVGQVYAVEGENRPGRNAGAPLREGSARRIFTGADLPSGATRVLPQEVVERGDGAIRVREIPETTFIRPRGAEGRAGDVVLDSGTRLGAVELAILATIGVEEIVVAQRPRIAHLVTGDEIVAEGRQLNEGQIRDANSDLVAALLQTVGRAVMKHRRVSDDRDDLVKAVDEAAGRCDVLLISGGASVGDHDHTRAALEAAGFTFAAHGFNVRPGKPAGIARQGTQWAFALPGNPVSHLVTLRLFVLPILMGLEGAASPAPKMVRGTLTAPIPGPSPARDTFWPAKVEIADGSFQVTPCRFLSSGDLFGIAGCNALVSLPAGESIPKPGAEINFLSLDPQFP